MYNLLCFYKDAWWIVDVWIRCYMMNYWCLNMMLYDELLMFKYDVIWRCLWLMIMKLWCEVAVVVVTTVVVNVFKVVSVVQDDEVIRCCISCWVHAYSFYWRLDALWAFALYVEGLMPCELLLFMLRAWCPVSFCSLCWGLDALWVYLCSYVEGLMPWMVPHACLILLFYEISPLLLGNVVSLHG